MSRAVTDLAAFRVTTWNSCGGTVASRLAMLQPLMPDLVFLQECRPVAGLAADGELCQRTVNARKGLALASPTGRFSLTPVEPRSNTSGGCLAARVEGHDNFHVLGIWAQKNGGYVQDVLKSLRSHDDLLQAGPVIVLGDFNSGVPLTEGSNASLGHHELVRHLETELNLVSAYHQVHNIAHGAEQHATYFHRRKAIDPWHIDFCFLPKQWAKRIVDVTVGDDETWSLHSDHRPVTVTIRPSAPTSL
jgi:hypothetical protein